MSSGDSSVNLIVSEDEGDDEDRSLSIKSAAASLISRFPVAFKFLIFIRILDTTKYMYYGLAPDI